MEFFDLSIPYTPTPSPSPTRLKLVVKALELGYSGVAYDRVFKGVMSDKDVSTVAPFPLPSLLAAAPSLAESVRFHRELVGAKPAAPFRQYRRLTVVVENVVQATVLNGSNPVLRSYDLVAARPVNQAAFEQVCKFAEVDLISIDFSQKLSFRLKFPMVKAAIERGIYFEITYSHLISSPHLRRETLPNAKMLVSWTRGKNLIFSSAASTANFIRGPYDAANLCSLFGVSLEQAKAAVSRNCRSLLAGALRKKQCHKEAIRVENISASEANSNKALFGSWIDWDPISSGEGDLLPVNNSDSPCEDVRNRIPSNQEKTPPAQAMKTSFFCDIKGKGSCFTSGEPSSPYVLGQFLTTETIAGSESNIPSFGCLTKSSSSIKPCNSFAKQSAHTSPDMVDMAVVHDPPIHPECDTVIHESRSGTSLNNGDETKPSDLSPEMATNTDEDFVIYAAADTINLKVFSEEDNRVPSNGTEISNMDRMEIDSSSTRNEATEPSTANTGDICSNSLLVEQPSVVAEDLLRAKSSLHGCGTLTQECSTNTVSEEHIDDAMPDNDVMLNKGDLDDPRLLEHGFSVPVRPNAPILKDLVNIEEQKQQINHASECPVPQILKPGKDKCTQKLKRQPVQFSSKGFLKPLLFKRKPSKSKRTKKA